MAMANVADILARRGLRVLMVDFDLEAPGLEQFFRINHDGVRRSPGLLDLLLDYKRSMSMGGHGDTRFREVSRYIVPVFPSLSGGGGLHLLPAGQRHDPEQLARYALSLRTFDWQDFYYHWQGERFFEWLRRALTPEPYDLVLVDSRTGVTEMGGVCGYQLADTIVMLCAANHQNVNGTASMLRDFRSPAVEALRRDRALDIVVVPARIEQGDPALLEEFFGRFDEAFSMLVPPELDGRGIGFRDLTIPYEPLYAFEEQVVSDPGQACRLRAAGRRGGAAGGAPGLQWRASVRAGTWARGVAGPGAGPVRRRQAFRRLRRLPLCERGHGRPAAGLLPHRARPAGVQRRRPARRHRLAGGAGGIPVPQQGAGAGAGARGTGRVPEAPSGPGPADLAAGGGHAGGAGAAPRRRQRRAGGGGAGALPGGGPAPR
jgi:hypothetical protein